MKNIIKRGTSLLLVLAMLLSFAAVVGAADERLPVEGEKPVTLSLDSVVLRQGSTEIQYVPVRLTIEPGFAITGFQLAAVSSDESAVEVTGFYPKRPLKIYEDGSVNYDETIGTIFGKLYSNYGSSESKDPVQKFACANGKGVTSETISTRAEDGVIKEPDLAGYIGVKVKDGAQSGAYQLSIIPNASRDRDTTKRNNIVFTIGTQNTYTDAYATLNAGTAIVLPEGASLPTVILTKTAFAAPTMATYDPEQGVDLLNYLKIVDKDGNLHDASSAADTSITGNYVSNGALKLMPSSGNSGNIIVNNLHAADDENITASATLTYTVTKDTVRTPWRAGFSTHNGKYKTQADFDADFAKYPPKAPAFDGGAEHNGTSVYPNVFDQYGKVMEGYSFVPLVTLYNAADHTTPLANEAGNADPAYFAVHFNYNTATGKWASDTLYYTKELKKDVWCKIELGVIGPDGEKANIQADTLEFLIQSQYPQAASAKLELRDMNDKEFPSGPMTTIAIPWGTIPTNTYTVHVSDFRQANGETMPEGTEPSATDVTIALDGTYDGVSIENGNKLVISKTAQAGTVTVKATLNGKELDTLTLTLQRAASKAADAWVYDRANKTANTNSKVLPTLSGVENGKATLPGIREGDELVLTFGPGCVVDQYGEIYQVEGKDFLRHSQYALYKQSSTNPETYELCAEAVRSVNAEGVVTATIKNSLDSDGNLRVQPGTYKFGTYNDNFFNGMTRFDLNKLLMSEPFELKKAASVYTGEVDFFGQSTIYVPYKHGTLGGTKTSSTVLGAILKDQYGETKTGVTSIVPEYTLSEIKLNGKEVTDNAVTVAKAAGYSGGQIEIKLSPDAAKYFGDKEEINLIAKMEATVDGETVSGIPVKITVKKDPSTLSAVYIGMDTKPDLEMPKWTWNVNVGDSEKETTINLTSPETETKYYFDIKYFDQYGVETTSTFGMSGEPDKLIWTSGPVLTVKPNAEGTATLDIPGTNKEYRFNVKFAKMGFVNKDGGDYKVDMWMNTNERTYGQDGKRTWAEVCTKWGVAAYPDVHIRTEDGKAGEKVTDKVKVVVKQNGEEVYDSFKTYTEAPKANAGTYTIELVYVKTEGEGETATTTFYPIDNTTFEITPKEVTITINPPAGTAAEIKKEYDGTTDLPTSGLYLMPDGVVTGDGVSIDTSMLEFASANAGENIAIRLKEAGTNCLKTASGEPATNYNVDLSELKGTITPRQLTVTPNEKTFTYGQDTEINAALEREYTVSNNLEGAKAATITGSMKLTTTSGADVTVYDAGTYNVVNDDLSAGTNYEIEFPATSVQWTINRKLLTKVKNSGLPSSGFGANTDEGCISHLLTMSATDKDGMPIGILAVSDFVDASALSFPSNTVYVTGQNGTKYPAPGPYMLNVTKPKKDIGKNYRVDETTVYEFDYTVNKLDASLLTVTLTEDMYTYNGMEQGPTVSVTYTNRNNDTLDLTSISNISGARATNAATYTINVTAPKVATDTQTATWKINPKSINSPDVKIVLKDLYYTGENVNLRDAVVKLVDEGIGENGVDLVKEDDWRFVGPFVLTNVGSMDVKIYGWGNYYGENEYRTFTVELKKAGAALDDTQLEGKQATRNKTNVIELSPKYKLAGDPTIEVVGSSEWLDNNSVSAEYKDGKIKITLNVKDGPVTETSKVKLKLTIAGTNNYAETVKEFDVKIIEKLVQNFTIAPATGDRAYSYSEGSVQMVATNAVGTVHWQIATDTSGGTAKIDSNGKLELGHPGTVKVVATANETDAYAAASQTYVLTITKGQVMITASSATMTANDPLPGFSATASGLNPNDSVSEVFQTLTASAATDGKTAGTYAVNASATLKTDFVPRYTLRFVPGTLTVNPAQTAIDVVLPIIIGGNTCANGYANCACESFYDLDASRWYHEAIDWAYSLGLMNGTTKSTFGPNAAATRAQTWTMLARIAGQDTRRSSTWYEVGQKWAMNLGITDGTNPMGSLTREQLAAMLYRYVGSPAVNGTLTFTDSANVSTWARNAMIWAVQNGILDGVGGNRLNPKGTTTRAQAAAIFMRFSKLINK